MHYLNLSLALRAYRHLVRCDVQLRRGNFAALCDTVRSEPVRIGTNIADAVEVACAAIDLACVWYWRRVLCLQRSAATCCLLKQLGVAAELVIGAQLLPFEAHAWVEVNGRAVNEALFVIQAYAVLERL